MSALRKVGTFLRHNVNNIAVPQSKRCLLMRPSKPPSNVITNFAQYATHEVTQYKGFKIVSATEEDRRPILSLLRKTYFIDEPLLATCGLSGNVPPEFEEYALSSLKEGTTVMAIEDDRRAVRAVCINATFSAEAANKPLAMEEFIQDKNLSSVLKFWVHVERDADLFTRFNVRHMWHMRFLATHPSYRGEGLAKHLTSISTDLAKKMKYECARIDCSNYYSSRMANSLNIPCVYTKYYKDYTEEKLYVRPPHDAYKVYVLRTWDRNDYSGVIQT